MAHKTRLPHAIIEYQSDHGIWVEVIRREHWPRQYAPEIWLREMAFQRRAFYANRTYVKRLGQMYWWIRIFGFPEVSKDEKEG